MSDKTFHVEIVTPRSQVYSGEATIVTLPGVVSPFQVLYNHAPLLTQLEVGDLKIVGPDQRETHFATSGGFVEMKDNHLTVIAETIEPAANIDVSRAEQAKMRAQERLQQARLHHDVTVDTARAEASLARAINRLRVSGRGMRG
jgi:F-type H+-transporting ATPase subunit epsilon